MSTFEFNFDTESTGFSGKVDESQSVKAIYKHS